MRKNITFEHVGEVMIKAILLVSVVLISNLSLKAQIIIARQDGTSLKLNAEGKWDQIDTAEPDRKKIHSFRIPYSSNTLIDGMNKRYGIRFDAEKWQVLRGPDYKGDLYSFELQFYHRNGEGFALILADTLQRPIEKIISQSLENIKGNSTAFTVAYGEAFRVNKNLVYMVIIQAKQRGIPITYYNYYYAGSEGSYQLLTYCGQQSFWKFEDDFKDLLNGFITYKDR